MSLSCYPRSPRLRGDLFPPARGAGAGRRGADFSCSFSSVVPALPWCGVGVGFFAPSQASPTASCSASCFTPGSLAISTALTSLFSGFGLNRCTSYSWNMMLENRFRNDYLFADFVGFRISRRWGWPLSAVSLQRRVSNARCFGTDSFQFSFVHFYYCCCCCCCWFCCCLFILFWPNCLESAFL